MAKHLLEVLKKWKPRKDYEIVTDQSLSFFAITADESTNLDMVPIGEKSRKKHWELE